MKRGGAGKRRDASEKSIVEALRATGWQVWQLNGAGCPDLLVYRAGQFSALEVKTGSGRLTALQRDVPWPVVRTVDEALRVISAQAPRGTG